MKSNLCLKLFFVASLFVMPGLAMGTDIWTLPAYQACLNNSTNSELKNLKPYQNLPDEGPQMTVEFCNMRIEQYRAAIGSETISSDRCIRYDDPAHGQSALVIADADDVLYACKTDTIGMHIAYQDVVELNEIGEKAYSDSDTLAQQRMADLIAPFEKKLQDLSTLAERNNLDFIGWWISLLGPNGRLYLEEYNFSLTTD